MINPGGGLGIGLSLVKSLAELHGGTVTAFSLGKGKGSEFVVTLPLSIDQSEPSGDNLTPLALDSELQSNSVESPCQILVVDDNEDAANMMEALLSMENYSVHKAYDGKTAMEIASEFTPSVGLLDIGLPDIDGYTLAAHLRKAFAQMCLIAISGWGQEEDRKKSYEAGFDFHFIKPVNLGNVVKLVRRHLMKCDS